MAARHEADRRAAAAAAAGGYSLCGIQPRNFLTTLFLGVLFGFGITYVCLCVLTATSASLRLYGGLPAGRSLPANVRAGGSAIGRGGRSALAFAGDHDDDGSVGGVFGGGGYDDGRRLGGSLDSLNPAAVSGGSNHHLQYGRRVIGGGPPLLRRSLLSPRSIYEHIADPHAGNSLLLERDAPLEPVSFHNHRDRTESSSSSGSAGAVRVLCFVLTSPRTHASKAAHVKATWGRRCDRLLFMSSVHDSQLPTIALPVSREDRDHLWEKTKLAFSEIYDRYLDTADWFLKADDDSYVIVENLRYFLSSHNSSEPLYFGHKFKPYVKQGYMSGGAGYVISKEAVKRFVEVGVRSNRTRCRRDHGGAEDVEFGRCMAELGVRAGDSRDSEGRGRFFPLAPEAHLIPGHMPADFWFWNYTYYPVKAGMECCSDTAISFHYISPNMMYVMEYLLYHLRPFGLRHYIEPIASATVGRKELLRSPSPPSLPSQTATFSPTDQEHHR